MLLRKLAVSGIVGFFILINAGCDVVPSAEEAAEANEDRSQFQVPKGMVVTVGDAQVLIQWPQYFNATSYTLYWSNQPGLTKTNANSMIVNDTSYLHKELTNGIPYYYSFSALMDTGETHLSTVISATPDFKALPATDAEKFQIIVGDNRNTIDWAIVAGATSYSLYWTMGALEEVSLESKRIDFVNPPFVHDNLTNGAQYNYVVVANNHEKPGLLPLAISGTPFKPVPTAPVDITLAYTTGQLEINFNDVSNGEHFNLYWKTSPGVTRSDQRIEHIQSPFKHAVLNADTVYFYRLEAINSGGASVLSAEFSVDTNGAGLPKPPTLIVSDLPNIPDVPGIDPGNQQLTLGWDASDPNTKAYNIYWKTVSGEASLTEHKIANVRPPYIHTDLVNGVQVTYRLTSINDSGESTSTIERSLTPQIIKPGVPANVTAAAADARIAISWASVSGASDYNVYWRPSDSPPEQTTVERNVLSPFLKENLQNGLSYTFEVTANNTSGEGEKSLSVSEIPQIPPPLAPSKIIASAGNAQVHLSWTHEDPSNRQQVNGFRVYWSGTPDVTPNTANLIDVGLESTFLHDQLANGRDYYYIITAVNAGGESTPSAEIQSLPQVEVPGAPSEVSAETGNAQVTIRWLEDQTGPNYNLYWWTEDLSLQQSDKTVVANVLPGHTVEGLNNGSAYHFYVAAFNPAGESIFSNDVIATPQIPPPSQTTATIEAIAGNTQVQMFWEPIPTATSYKLYWSTTANINPNKTPYFTDIQTGFMHTGLSNGNTYYYAISGVNAGGEGPLSNISSATPQVPAPTVPPSNIAVTSSDAEVMITWDTTAAEGVDSYNVYWTTTATAPLAEWIKIRGFVSGDFHRQLTNGETYNYKVAAVNAGGESPLSISLQATPQVAPPTAPSGLTASVINDTQVSLNWYQSTDLNYNLYRSETAIVSITGAGVNKVTNVKAIYVDTGLTQGTTYYYVLTAENPGGESSPSQVVSVTPELIPANTPTNLSVVAGDAATTIFWQNIADPLATYTLYWTDNATNGAQLGSQLTSANAIPNVSSPFQHSLLTNGKPYYYVVTATGQAESLASRVASATPQVPPVGPPKGFSVTAGVGQVTANWDTSNYASNVSFNLYWTDQANTSPLSDNSVIGVTPPYTQSGLAANTTRAYAVTAVNAAGESAATIVMSATAGAPPNTAPIIAEGTQTSNGKQINVAMSEDSAPVPFNLVLNAYDNEGDTLTWSINQQPTVAGATATFAVQANSATIHYTPPTNFNGSDTFIARVTDGKAPPEDISINVTVNPVNDLPQFGSLPSSLEAFSGLQYSYTVKVSDLETPLADLKITSTNIPSWMTLLDSAPGEATLSGTPSLSNLGLIGNDVTLTVTDTSGGFSDQTFIINVATGVAVTSPANSIAQVSNAVAGLETVITIQAVDENGINRTTGGDFVTVLVSGPNQNPNGTPLVLDTTDNGDGSYTALYTPGVAGTDSINITIGGAGIGGGALSGVVSPNLAPVATDDIVHTYRNAADVEINVLANDSDPENGALTLLSFTNGAFGSVVESLSNTLVYNPELNRSGIDTFSYDVQDPYGNTSTASVSVSISAWNTPVQIGSGNGMEFAASLDGQAIALWENGESLYSNRFIVGAGWQTALPIYTVGSAGAVNNQRLVMNGIGQALAVWKSVENSSAQFGYSLFSNSQWQSTTRPWPNVNVNQDTDIHLSMDDNGRASVVWDQKDAGANNTIWQNSLISQNWSSLDTEIAQSALAAQNPKTVTNGDRTIVAWLQGSPASVWWRYKNASIWELEEPISDISLTATNVQIAMGQSGNGLIVWQEQDINNKISLLARPFSYPVGSIPTLEQAFQLDNGDGDVSEAQLINDIAGDAVIVWRQLSSAGPTIWSYRIAGTSRILEKISDSNDINPTNPIIRLNENGEIFTLWLDGDRIRFRKFQTIWQPIEILANVNQLLLDSLRLNVDSLGNAIAIWNNLDTQSTIWSSDYCNNPINCQINTSTHQIVNQACVNCHNGVDATGKTNLHLLTLDTCHLCHIDNVWIPANFNHSGTVGLCETCHDGAPLTGKPNGHRVTLFGCANCHAPPSWLPLIFPSHANYTSNECISCHDGIGISGKSSGHMPTTDICGTCHSVAPSSWAPVSSVDHNQVLGTCIVCHNGVGISGKPTNHIATLDFCDACHAVFPSPWAPVPASSVDHGQVLGPCSSCHSLFGGHIDSSLSECDACHSVPPATWATIVAVDHNLIFVSCSSCHNGVLATGKPTTHPGTTDLCEACHSAAPSPWVLVFNVDHAEVFGTCSSCHTMSLGHINTSNICDACHSVILWSPAINVDHTQVFGTCSSCHTMNAGHLNTTTICEACHSVTPLVWVVPASRVDHSQVIGTCSGCHNGTIATGKLNHPLTTDVCENCHLVTSFTQFAQSINHGDALEPRCDNCHNGGFAFGPGSHTGCTIGTFDCGECHSVSSWFSGVTCQVVVPPP